MLARLTPSLAAACAPAAAACRDEREARGSAAAQSVNPKAAPRNESGLRSAASGAAGQGAAACRAHHVNGGGARSWLRRGLGAAAGACGWPGGDREEGREGDDPPCSGRSPRRAQAAANTDLSPGRSLLCCRGLPGRSGRRSDGHVPDAAERPAPPIGRPLGLLARGLSTRSTHASSKEEGGRGGSLRIPSLDTYFVVWGGKRTHNHLGMTGSKTNPSK